MGTMWDYSGHYETFSRQVTRLCGKIFFERFAHHPLKGRKFFFRARCSPPRVTPKHECCKLDSHAVKSVVKLNFFQRICASQNCAELWTCSVSDRSPIGESGLADR